MKIEIDEIGTLYTPAVVDANGNITTPPEELAGWHVNTSWPIDEWSSNKVTPSTPRRMFAGVDTHFYTFTDSQAFEQAKEGVVFEYEIVNVPASISMRQARLALLSINKLATVETVINSLTEPTKTQAQIEWQYSNEVQRQNGFVSMIAPALGLTPKQVDQLFIDGKAL